MANFKHCYVDIGFVIKLIKGKIAKVFQFWSLNTDFMFAISYL